MASTVTHEFVSGETDGPDPSVLRPSDWNSEHVLALDAADIEVDPTVLGAADVQAALEALEAATPATPGLAAVLIAGNDAEGQAITSSVGGLTITSADGELVIAVPDAVTPVVKVTLDAAEFRVNQPATGAQIKISALGAITLERGTVAIRLEADDELDLTTDGIVNLSGAAGSLVIGATLISLNGLPTSDPAVASALWVDTAADFVVKVSQG